MLWAYISNFTQLIRLCASTCIVHWKAWLGGAIASLGSWDVPMNTVVTWVGIFSMLIFAVMHHQKSNVQMFMVQNQSARSFSKWDLLVWYGVAAVLFILVLMSMISWGFLIYDIDSDLPYSVSMRLLPRIEGVQGRYFYPILPLLLIPIHTKKDYLSFIPAYLYKICYYLLMTIYPITRLLVRYWGIGSW